MLEQDAGAAPGPAAGQTLSLEVATITGTRTFTASDIDSAMPAGAVAKALSAQLNLPNNVPWMLRADNSAAFLESERPIGDQVQTGSRVTLSPKTHLGG